MNTSSFLCRPPSRVTLSELRDCANDNIRLLKKRTGYSYDAVAQGEASRPQDNETCTRYLPIHS